MALPRGCLRFVIVVYPEHTHFLTFVKVRGNNREYTLFSFSFGAKIEKNILCGMPLVRVNC